MALVDGGFAVKIPEFVNNLEPTLLSQGAEALTLLVKNPSDPDHKCVAKYRPPKPYRIEVLDKQLRKKRTTAESKVINKLTENNIPCPALISIDTKNGLLFMEFIDGKTLKQFVWDNGDTEQTQDLFYQLGKLVAGMHANNITHGDLTTSNAIVRGNDLVAIDFGLSNMAANIEDKAVDLYVLERAIGSTHAEHSQEFNDKVLEGYQKEFADRQMLTQILTRLQTVRQRGRKRSMLG